MTPAAATKLGGPAAQAVDATSADKKGTLLGNAQRKTVVGHEVASTVARMATCLEIAQSLANNNASGREAASTAEKKATSQETVRKAGIVNQRVASTAERRVTSQESVLKKENRDRVSATSVERKDTSRVTALTKVAETLTGEAKDTVTTTKPS